MAIFGSGRITSTMAAIKGRGVKYCPAPPFTSSAFFWSSPSYASPFTSAESDDHCSLSMRSTISRRSFAGS
jgi:hypothetical protein